jgi:hypothetical protein
MRLPLSTARSGLFAIALLGLPVWGCAPVTLPVPPAGPTNGGAGDVGADRNAVAAASDPFGESVKSVTYLDQNWTSADSQRFYFTSQGSQVLPYDWFLALEQPDGETPFRDQSNILKYRYLPQKPDAMNPDGLPVGFVKDVGTDRAWLGFTCATCHTNEIHYKGVAYRVDGAPSLGDITGLLRSLTLALKATHDGSDKFDRFAKKVLADRDGPVARQALKAQLAHVIEMREGYNARNFPPGDVAGYGRIDAFGAILNEVYHHAVRARDLTSDTVNTKPADAPVSIPFLWDTPQHDLLQWNGSAENGGPANVGALARNVGEVLGVFGDFEIPERFAPLGYPSSVRVGNLFDLESWVTTLWSPKWPAEFPPIDDAKRDQGRALFVKYCVECHKDIDRTDPRRKVVAQMRATGTDPRMAENFADRVGSAGKLEGGFSIFFPLVGQKIPAEAPAGLMLKNAVIGTIVGSPFRPPADALSTIDLEAQKRPLTPEHTANVAETGTKYKGRPLDGIWATAPYLHNGSVPSLDALLRPAKDRPETFSVGSRAFDPAVVGFKQDAPGVFLFRVKDPSGRPIPGNSNAGHEYGTGLSDAERGQLLDYLKSL